jgi:hypothetical protein
MLALTTMRALATMVSLPIFHEIVSTSKGGPVALKMIGITSP